MIIGCFFAACPNGSSWNLFGSVQFDHEHRRIRVLLLTGVFKDVEGLDLYDFLRLAGYDLVLCLLAVHVLRRLIGLDMAVTTRRWFGYGFDTWQVYDISALCTNKRSYTGCSVIVDVSVHRFGWLKEIKLDIITRFESDWLAFSMSWLQGWVSS